MEYEESEIQVLDQGMKFKKLTQEKNIWETMKRPSL